MGVFFLFLANDSRRCSESSSYYPVPCRSVDDEVRAVGTLVVQDKDLLRKHRQDLGPSDTTDEETGAVPRSEPVGPDPTPSGTVIQGK